MTVSGDVLRHHLDYTAWATGRLLNAAAQLTPDQFRHDFATADKSVLGTLFHIYESERLWLARIERADASKLHYDPQELAMLEERWPALHQRWRNWAGSLAESDFENPLLYSDLKGNQWEQPVWQIVLHVVNHGTHHRGQVSGFLRALGQTPPFLDLIAYYRQLQ